MLWLLSQERARDAGQSGPGRVGWAEWAGQSGQGRVGRVGWAEW